MMSQAAEKDKSGVVQWIGLGLAVFAPITGMLLQLAVSRRREYAADALGTKIAGSVEGLVLALQKISRDRIQLPGTYYATAHLFLHSPYQQGDWLEKIMSTHPPVEERIARLKEMR